MRAYTDDELKALDPVEYAKAWNIERNAEAEAEGFEMWSLIPEDAEFFESRGQKTAYDYERDCALSVLSDVYKEFNRVRPRGIYETKDMTLSEIEAATLAIYDAHEPKEGA